MGLREGGGNCLKYLKRGWNRTEGRGNKDLKKGGKLGQWVGALKRGGWKPVTNYNDKSCDYNSFHASVLYLYKFPYWYRKWSIDVNWVNPLVLGVH